jgi:hypothetical protein
MLHEHLRAELMYDAQCLPNAQPPPHVAAAPPLSLSLSLFPSLPRGSQCSPRDGDACGRCCTLREGPRLRRLAAVRRRLSDLAPPRARRRRVLHEQRLELFTERLKRLGAGGSEMVGYQAAAAEGLPGAAAGSSSGLAAAAVGGPTAAAEAPAAAVSPAGDGGGGAAAAAGAATTLRSDGGKQYQAQRQAADSAAAVLLRS